MSYQVKIDRKVLKRLEKIPEPFYKSLKDSILELGDEPRPNGYIKLKGRAGYRIRVGNYRVIYEIEDSIKIVEVLDVGHRGDIYEG
jgi:mRNA interferase RelE/StbE